MNEKILVVDDNDANLYILETLLHGHGLDVTLARNGREALDKAHLCAPDLVISDILMPVMDGYTLCRQWRSDDQLKFIPFIFYTATYTERKDEDFALSLGADRFIIKPQEPEILMKIINKALGEKHVPQKAAVMPLGEDMEFFRRHNGALFRKLEKKMLDLQIANQKMTIMEERYRLIFQNVMDVICLIDTAGKFLSISPSLERILGYDPKELIGAPVSELKNIMAPESFLQVMDDTRLVLQGETVSGRIYRFIARDGTPRFGEVNGSPFVREGQVIGMISVIRDITLRTLAQEKLRDSEKKYRDLFEFLPIPVYEMDLEGNITSANRAIFATFGGTEKDLEKSFKVWQLLSPEGIEKSRRNIQGLIQGNRVEGTEYTLRRLDGSVFPAIVVSGLIRRGDGPLGLLGAVIDITERRKAEQDLRRMNAFLDSIIENIPDMLFLKDAKELRFIRFNKAGADLLGCSIDDLLGKNDYDFFPREQADLLIEKDQEALSGKMFVDIPEECLQTRDKGTRILHTRKVPILNAAGAPEYLLGISEDITERKKAADKLQQTLERLNRAINTTIQVMVSAVEVRDPYTSGHQFRSADLARAIAAEMNFSQDMIEAVRVAASIHDIGKLSVPAEILSKPTKLSDLEFSLVKAHSEKGYAMLKDVESPWQLAEIVYQHHERMNGSGYPRRLKGDELLIEARILAVADVVEAMASHRPYRASLGLNAALREIVDKRGTFYDCDVVDACLRLFREKDYQLPERF